MKKVKHIGFGKVIDYTYAKELPKHQGIMRFASAMGIAKQAQDEKEKDSSGDYDKLIEYNPDFLYVRVRAVTANIPNNNGDLFEVEELKKKYKTFIDQRVFKNHKSDDVTNALGNIVDAIWVENPQDQEHPYVECLLRIDRKKDPEIVRGIEEGYINDVSMGALASGSLVTLEDYTVKKIEEIRMDDIIRTHAGNVSGIKNIQMIPYKNEIYKVKVLGIHDELGITEEHPAYIIKKDELNCNKEYNYRAKCYPGNKQINKSCASHNCGVEEKQYVMEFVEAEDLHIGDYVAFPFPTEEITPDYVTKDFARLLGYYVAEGWVRTGNVNLIQFCLRADNEQEIDEVKRLIDRVKPGIHINEDYFMDRNGCYISIYDKELRDLFLKLGGKYAKNKKLDGSVLVWDKEMQREFIGAYIDGAGFQFERDGMVYISTSSENLANQIQIILCRLGIISNIGKLKHVAGENSVVETGKISIEYQVGIGSYYANSLCDYSKSISYKEVFRRSDRKFIYENYMMSPIVGIRKEYYEGFVYNIESDIDESFVANRIAVHNCRVEYSRCSCCGNEAHTEDDYCDCVKKYKGQKYCPVHKKNLGEYGIYEANFGVEFFEISFVTDGADREAVVKEIVAANYMNEKDFRTKLANVGQVLVDTTNPMFQEMGMYMKKVASKEIISSKDKGTVDKALDLISAFVD